MEDTWYCSHLGIMVHIFTQPLLEGIDRVVSVCVHEIVVQRMEIELRDQFKPWFPHLHTADQSQCEVGRCQKGVQRGALLSSCTTWQAVLMKHNGFLSFWSKMMKKPLNLSWAAITSKPAQWPYRVCKEFDFCVAFCWHMTQVSASWSDDGIA